MKHHRTNFVYVIRDIVHHPISVCTSERSAQAQLKVLAAYLCFDYSTTIVHQHKSFISFANLYSIDYVEVPLLKVTSHFAKHFGFDDIPTNNNND